MSSDRRSLLDALGGLASHPTCVTWTPEGADPVAVARLTGADGVLVSATHPGAADLVARLHSEAAASIWAVSGPLGRFAEAVGWSDAFRLTAADPQGTVERLSEFANTGIDDVLRGVAAGADVLWIADDIAGAEGWLVDPLFAEKDLAPLWGGLLGRWPLEERPAVFHSDGDVRALYRTLASIGFSGVHLAASQAQVSTMARAARSAGLVPIGGITAATLVRRGRECAGVDAARLAAGGPLVVADDGGLTSDLELEALRTAFETVRSRLSSRP